MDPQQNPQGSPPQQPQQPTVTAPPQPLQPLQPAAPQPQTAYAQPSYQVAPAAVGRSKKPFIIGGAVVAILIIGGTALALSGSDKPTVKSDYKYPSAGNYGSDSPTSDTKKPVTQAKEIIPVNKSIRDDGLGYNISVVSAGLAEVAIPARYKENNSDKTVVTVKITATSDGKYSTSPSNLDVRLLGTNNEIVSPTSLSDDDIAALSYKPLSQTTGNNVSGYVVFWVPTDQLSKLTFRYKRSALKVINGSQTIPAQSTDIVIR